MSSQLAYLILAADRRCLEGGEGAFSVLDWRSKAAAEYADRLLPEKRWLAATPWKLPCTCVACLSRALGQARHGRGGHEVRGHASCHRLQEPL